MIKSNCKLSYPLWCLFLMLMTLSVLGLSFYFEYVQELTPCPLCLMQRLCVMLLLILTCLSCFFYRPRIQNKCLWLQVVVAGMGIFFAARQLWLQSLPVDQIPICLPGIGVMIRYLPWQQVAHALLFGAGDCAQVSWSWLGLSMAAWTCCYFVGMLIASLISLFGFNSSYHRFT